MIRRSIADLRTLCNGHLYSESGVPEGVDAPHGFVRLGYDAPVTENWEQVHSRARRLETHGWIVWYELDAGEGTYAALTERGRGLLDTWKDSEVAVAELLDPDEGGGVPEFIEFAVERELEAEDSVPDGGVERSAAGAYPSVECEGCGVQMTDGHLCNDCERAGVSIYCG